MELNLHDICFREKCLTRFLKEWIIIQDGGSRWIDQNKQPRGNISFYFFFQGSFLGSPYR